MSGQANPNAWVIRAEEDYLLAIMALRQPRPLTYGACFHAQQVAEKYLKAVLVRGGQPFPRTHDLVALYTLCLRLQPVPVISLTDLNLLTAYGVQVRYPGPVPAVAEARRAVLGAGRVRRVCRRLLGLSK